jgi:spectinomycin phosphotransferase
MLEKPDLPDHTLAACVQEQYGIPVAAITFLPLGDDINTAVYRVVADDGTQYFLKLRSGAFDQATVALPHYLRQRGIRQIIPTLETTTHHLWTRIDRFALTLAPFIPGHSGVTVPLFPHQWQQLGAALKGIHTTTIPAPLADGIPHETYSPHWRSRVTEYQATIETTDFPETTAAKLATVMRARRDEITHIVTRATSLGEALQTRSLPQVLCHADLHAANVLIDGAETLYIVDWDTMTFAPKERDLMFIGAGICGVWQTPHETALFYHGYGHTHIDQTALAYYRYERIVQDIAAFCDQLLLTDHGGADREVGLHHFLSQFTPGSVVDIANATDVHQDAEKGQA